MMILNKKQDPAIMLVTMPKCRNNGFFFIISYAVNKPGDGGPPPTTEPPGATEDTPVSVVVSGVVVGIVVGVAIVVAGVVTCRAHRNAASPSAKDHKKCHNTPSSDSLLQLPQATAYQTCSSYPSCGKW